MLDKNCATFYLPVMTWDEELDAAGLLCPLPVLKAQRRLRGMAGGRVLRLVTTDPAAKIDVPHFCEQSGHELLESEISGNATFYLIRKRA